MSYQDNLRCGHQVPSEQLKTRVLCQACGRMQDVIARLGRAGVIAPEDREVPKR